MDPIISSALQQQQDIQAMEVSASVLKKTISVQKSVSDAILTILDSAMVESPAGKTLGAGQNFDASA